jgi:hypothetical protein
MEETTPLQFTFNDWWIYKEYLTYLAPIHGFTAYHMRERLGPKFMEKDPECRFIFSLLYSLVEEEFLQVEEPPFPKFAIFRLRVLPGIGGTAEEEGAGSVWRSPIEATARDARELGKPARDGTGDESEDESDDENFFMRRLY